MSRGVTVLMQVQVSGGRDGLDWPAPGNPLVVPADEAEALIAGGLARAVEVKVDEPKVETATASTRRKNA